MLIYSSLTGSGFPDGPGSMVGIPMGQPMGTCGGPGLVDSPTSNHTDSLDTVHIEVDQPSIPHVSAYLLCACITGQRVRVGHGR